MVTQSLLSISFSERTKEDFSAAFTYFAQTVIDVLLLSAENTKTEPFL